MPSRYFAGHLMIATEGMTGRFKPWTLHGRKITPIQQTCGTKCSIETQNCYCRCRTVTPVTLTPSARVTLSDAFLCDIEAINS